MHEYVCYYVFAYVYIFTIIYYIIKTRLCNIIFTCTLEEYKQYDVERLDHEKNYKRLSVSLYSNI